MNEAFPEQEAGTALLTVLLLVAVMAVITAAALDRLNLATYRAANNSAIAQAQGYTRSIALIGTRRLESLTSRNAAQLTLEGDWLDKDFPVPVDHGIAIGRLTDWNNCFNLNSLVTRKKVQDSDEGPLVVNPSMIAQFRMLMRQLRIDEVMAARISDSVADWIDNDDITLPSGAETGDYRAAEAGVVPPNQLMVVVSELRAVNGVTPEIFDRLQNHVCVLPEPVATKLNINTLSPDNAVLLTMLIGDQLPQSRVKQILVNRPSRGYGSLVRFWGMPQLAKLQISQAVKSQVGLKSEWFLMQNKIRIGRIEYVSQSLITLTGGGRPWMIWHHPGVSG